MANKLDIDNIKNKVKGEMFWNNGKTTICILKMENGFEVVGSSGCVDHANFDEEIGKDVARRKAMDGAFLLEGYLLQERIARGEVNRDDD